MITVFPDASHTRSSRSCSSKRVSESSCENGSSLDPPAAGIFVSARIDVAITIVFTRPSRFTTPSRMSTRAVPWVPFMTRATSAP